MGTLNYANGDRYTGDWVFGKKHGWGVYKHADGVVYAGEWHEDKQEGFGRTQFSDGTWYESTKTGQPVEQEKHL